MQETLYCYPMNDAQQLLAGISWFDIADPGSPDLDEFGRRFHLHELQIEDCRHRPQPAKVDVYGNYVHTYLLVCMVWLIESSALAGDALAMDDDLGVR
jgi:Mg2+ and Co2+ transporter CorA